jgi:predicted RNase H-like nuclease (RuvC/YqgF family)
MPIGDYLKTAAAQLRRAALVRRDETQDLRREITTREQEVSRQINDLRKVMDQLQRNMGATQNSAISAAMVSEKNALEQQIRDLQSNLEREKQRINQEIQWKESQVGTLNNQATDFERQASAGGL